MPQRRTRMFGLLRNKLAGFINGLTGKGEKKDAASAATAETQVEKTAPVPVAEKKPELPQMERAVAPPTGKKAEEPSREQKKQAPEPKREAQPTVSSPKPEEEKPAQVHAVAPIHSPKPERKKEENPLPAVPEVNKPGHLLPIVHGEKKQEQKKPLQQPIFAPEEKKPEHEIDLSALSRRASSEKREMAPKIGLGTAIKSFFSGEVTIGEAEVSGLLSELELSLLEADVEYGVSMEVSSQLRSRLVGMRVPKGEVAKKTREAISQVLESIMDSENKFDFVKRVQQTEKPAKILFVGPNGAGKTTTMAKISRMLSEHGMTSVFSASDTFRAAAIEQTEVHGARLGVKVIKSKYGADPSSVAFDAVNYARSHNIDVVLIDSAGRQDTNANLLSELKKINRVAKPDIKLYIGESISGNALIDQIKAFQEAIGIDGAILTKLDCDAKGGTAISIAKATGIPVIFLGVGQRYEDLVPFDPHKIAQEIMT